MRPKPRAAIASLKARVMWKVPVILTFITRSQTLVSIFQGLPGP